MARIVLATTVQAPPAEIVKALDSAAGIAGFWTEEIDYRGAGEVFAAWFTDSPAPFQFRVDEVSAAGIRWTNTGEYPPFFAGTSVAWALQPDPDGGTMVHFTHDGWPDDELPMPMIAYVWAQVLASLKSYLETGAGMPLHTRA